MFHIAAQFTLLLTALRNAIGAFAAARARGPMVVFIGTQAFVETIPPPRHPPIPDETWAFLCARLVRLAQRFQALFARWEAGRLPKPRPHRPRKPRSSSTPANPVPRLPRARGWITAHIAAAGPCAGRLHDIFQLHPDMPRFLAEAPQAGRLLRPICHALAVDLPACLRLPPRPRNPRPTRAKPPEPPMRPLPAYVRAAARAWKRRGE